MKKKRSNIVLAYLPVFLFTLAYLIYQYLESGVSITVSPEKILRSLIVFYVILVLCGFIAYRILKDHIKTGLVLLLIAELFLFSQDFFIPSGLASVVLVLVLAGIRFFLKKKKSLKPISILLTVLGFGLVFFVSINRVQWDVAFSPTPETVEMPTQSLTLPDQSPDIYYIVMDAYTNSRILKELYEYDNSEFTDYLLEKGFIIPEDNYSNYPLTALSVSSTLNMDYIQTLIPDAQEWTKWWLISTLIEDSRVKNMLEEAGYRSVVVASDWDLTNNQDVDIYFSSFPVQLNEFEKLLIQKSPLRLLTPLLGQIMPLNTYDSHRETIEYSFETLSEIPDISGLKFVFTHIVVPHTPFVFDSDGNPITPSYEFSFIDGSSFPGTQEEYKQGYVDQVEYVNQQLEQVINLILENSETQPIIILMADHGSRLLTDYDTPANTCIHEAYSNFAAYYLPGADGSVIPDDITPVNVFRIVFDQYFGTEFGLLENAYYSSGDEYHYYQFEDVTSRIHQSCETTP